MQQLYKKHNSFINLKVKKSLDTKIFLNSLKVILDDKRNLINLNTDDFKIVDHIKKYFYFSGTKGKPKFVLSPNVIKEIQSINLKEIPKYLIHRYRYEIYPQLRITDDFPPYLQIEPTRLRNL